MGPRERPSVLRSTRCPRLEPRQLTLLHGFFLLGWLLGCSAEPPETQVPAEVPNDRQQPSDVRAHANQDIPSSRPQVRQEILSDASTSVASFTAIGYLTPFRKSVLKSEISGRILQLGAREGQAVRRGELLVEIDPRKKKIDVRMAERHLEVCQAQLYAVRAQMQVEQRVPKKADDRQGKHGDVAAQARIMRAEEEVDYACVQLERARLELDRTHILAPLDGTVSRTHVIAGSLVMAYADPLVEIMDCHRSVEFALSLADLRTVQSYAEPSIEVQVPGIESPYRATIHSVSPEVDRATQTVLVKCRIARDETEHLLPGTKVLVTITVP